MVKEFVTSVKRNKTENVLGIICLIFLCAVLILLNLGCTTMYSETVSEDGSFYKQKIKVPPFGKLEEGAASYSVEIAPDGSYKTQVGSNILGSDNTAQVEALNAAMSGFMNFGIELGKMISATGGIAAPSTTTE